MTDCQTCGAKSQLHLCNRCQTNLRDTLTQLAYRTATNFSTGETRPAPGWLELLEDAALGRTRLGESARRSTENNSPLPVHLDAATLLNDTHAMLTRWAQAINTTNETLTATGKEPM